MPLGLHFRRPSQTNMDEQVSAIGPWREVATKGPRLVKQKTVTVQCLYQEGGEKSARGAGSLISVKNLFTFI